MDLHCNNNLETYICPSTCSDLTVYQYIHIKLENVPESDEITIKPTQWETIILVTNISDDIFIKHVKYCLESNFFFACCLNINILKSSNVRLTASCFVYIQNREHYTLWTEIPILKSSP